MATGLANTPLINYFFYKQSTNIAQGQNIVCHAITAFADGGNGQLVLTTTATDTVDVGTAITIASTVNYDGNYTVISKTPTTINVSGTFVGTETGTWELASNITGANAGDPLDAGQIYFYDNTDKVTPQVTYQDRDETVPNTNPIILDAIGSAPPIYLIDNPYYIEIYDKFNNLVATLDNYLPSSSGGNGGTDGTEDNLFPSYGFDTIVDQGDFSINSLPADRPSNPISSGWVWEIDTAQSSPRNTYFFNVLGDSGITGNPKNEVVFQSTNNTSGDTLNNLQAIIGDYNYFQGTELVLSVYVRRLSGSVSDVPILLRRTKNGVNESPILVGNIAVTATRTQQIISFTVPLLTDSNYINDDILSLLFSFPLDQDFEIGVTATWLQVGDETSLSIQESSVSKEAAKLYMGRGFRILKRNNAYLSYGLPLTIGRFGTVDIQNSTGTIFIGMPSAIDLDEFTYDYAVSLDEFPGQQLLAGETISNISVDRLINYLQKNKVGKSRLTINASQNSNTVELTPLIGDTQKTASTASGTNVTIVKTVNELIYKLTAVIDNEMVNKVRFTFTEDFAPAQNNYNPVYTNGKGLVYSTSQGPTNAPIVSWIGNTTFSGFNDSGEVSFRSFFNNFLTIETIDAGSVSSQAVVDITFRNDSPTQYDTRLDYYDKQNFDLAANTLPAISPQDKLDLPYFNKDINRNIYESGGSNPGSATVTIGYFSYNDASAGNNPDPQPNPPIRCIRYSIDGDAGVNSPNGTLSTLVVDISAQDSAQEVALKTSDAVNSKWTEVITVNSLPSQGEYVTFSNRETEFTVIYYEQGTSLPSNPVANSYAIYVEFTSGQSNDTVAANTTLAIQNAQAGVPYWPDLGLPQIPKDSGTYYMVL